MDLVNDSEMILMVMVGLAMSGLAVTAFVGWWVQTSMRRPVASAEKTS